MRTRIAELRWKEVVDVQNGSRFGYVEDLEVDLESGQVRALVLPGRRRLFGLLGREEDRYIPWDRVRRFGEDIILVEQEPQPRALRRRRCERRGTGKARRSQTGGPFPMRGTKRGGGQRARSSQKFMRIWATSARVAVPAGSR